MEVRGKYEEEQADEIVFILDLFEGQLTYEEVMTMPQRRLRSLVDAKIRLIQKKNEIRDRLINEQNEKKRGPGR